MKIEAKEKLNDAKKDLSKVFISFHENLLNAKVVVVDDENEEK